MAARKGESVLLNCEASGEKPISITWTRDRMSFDPSSDPNRYEVSSSSSSMSSSSSSSFKNGLDQVVLDPSAPSVATKTLHSVKLGSMADKVTSGHEAGGPGGDTNWYFKCNWTSTTAAAADTEPVANQIL